MNKWMFLSLSYFIIVQSLVYAIPPLHDAATIGDETRVIQLLKSGATINEQDERGWTPLHYALAQGNRTTVWLLLEHGADINCAGHDGETPLDVAYPSFYNDMIVLLQAWRQRCAQESCIPDYLIIDNGSIPCEQRQRQLIANMLQNVSITDLMQIPSALDQSEEQLGVIEDEQRDECELPSRISKGFAEQPQASTVRRFMATSQTLLKNRCIKTCAFCGLGMSFFAAWYIRFMNNLQS